MAKNVSVFVSASGLIAGFWTELMQAVRELGGMDEDIHRLATPEGRPLIRQFATLIVGAARQVFRLVVNYGESVETLVARGKYDWANENITSQNFPTTRTGTAEVELHLVHLNHVVSTDEASRELDRMGYRPAELHEFLTLGIEKPELQREFPIVALGSVWRSPHGYRLCAYLYRDADGRDLDLHWVESDWLEDDRFLAVRK